MNQRVEFFVVAKENNRHFATRMASGLQKCRLIFLLKLSDCCCCLLLVSSLKLYALFTV